MSKKATVMLCASCEWIFRGDWECPKCGFGSYGARFVYGPKAYRYEKTQEPWKRKKMLAYGSKLDDEINEAIKSNIEKEIRGVFNGKHK